MWMADEVPGQVPGETSGPNGHCHNRLSTDPAETPARLHHSQCIGVMV